MPLTCLRFSLLRHAFFHATIAIITPLLDYAGQACYAITLITPFTILHMATLLDYDAADTLCAPAEYTHIIYFRHYIAATFTLPYAYYASILHYDVTLTLRYDYCYVIVITLR